MTRMVIYLCTVSTVGCSIVDYIIVDTNLFDLVESFEDRSDDESKHFPGVAKMSIKDGEQSTIT